MKKIYLALIGIMLLVISPEALSQTTSISGVVKDINGEGIPGATIQIKGTTNGTVADIDGSFVIDAQQGETLVFSSVGFQKKEVISGANTNLEIILNFDISELDEVVVVGYGTNTKKNISGAISQVKSEDFDKRTVGSVQEVLAGVVPGIQVTSNGGAPGSSATVLVRGLSSISTSNDPIYVVDGTPLDDIEFLNPRDIESIQVLKDASASSIYGSRGSNGVIIIKTKSGRAGEFNIDFSTKYGLQSVAKTPSLSNATQYARLRNMAAVNDGGNPVYENPETFGEGTNWWKELTQTAPIHDYRVSLTKGTKEMRIASSLSYFSQDGIIRGGGYDRLSFRLNTDYDIASWFNLGTAITVTNSNYTNGPNLTWDLMRLEPVTPVYLPDFERQGRNEFSIFSPTITDVPNAMGALVRNFSTTTYQRLVGNVNARIQIAQPLSLQLTYGYYGSNWEDNNFSPTYFIEPNDQSDLNTVSRDHNNRYRHISNNILTFEKTFQDHSFKLMGGMTFETETHRTLNGFGSNLPSNHKDLRYLNAAVQGYFASGTNENWTLLSYLGRFNYSFKNRYFFTANFRTDGSSKFPKQNQWATFPSVSGAWVISEENFLADLNWLDFLKIRASWGQIGNQNIPLDARQSNLANEYYITGPDQSVQVGVVPATIGNDQLLWETIEDINLGVDLAFIEGQIQASFDIYQRNIKDMLLTKPLPAYLGLGFDEQWANVGTMETKGFEFSLEYKKIVNKDLSFKVGVNGTNSKSIMTKLNGQDDVYLDGNDQRLNLLGYTEEGGTPGAFYGWVTDGIFQNQSEVINYTDNSGNQKQPLAQPGDFRFRDLNNDGVIDDQDRQIIGNPEPILTYGISYNVSYKAFSLSGLFTGKIGGDVLSPLKAYTHSGQGAYNSYAGLLEDAWQGEGSTNTQPRVSNQDRNQNFRYSDYYIQDGTFVRLKNIQLSYQVPSALLKPLHIKGLNIFLNAENLFTITGYDGLDPDIGGYATLRGVDWGNYPLPRIISSGINVRF